MYIKHFHPVCCNSFNVIYVVICSGCLEEYIGEMGIGKAKLSGRVRVYIQCLRQPESLLKYI